jgi:hypothetical protein
MLKKVLLASALTIGFAGSANAALITIDDFSTNVSPITTNTTVASSNVTGSIDRSITTVFNPAPPPSFTGVEVAAGNLNIGTAGVGNVTVTVSYSDFPSGAGSAFVGLGGPGGFVLSIVTSNLGGGATPAPSLSVFLVDPLGSATTVASAAILGGAQTIFANIPDLSVLGLPGSSIGFRVSGLADYDLSIDSFAIDTPEPASLALFGAGLAGLGLAARRRRKA